MSETGNAAAQRLRKVEAAGATLKIADSAAVTAWRTTAEAALVDAFGDHHTFVKRFREIPWTHQGGLSAIGRDPYSMVDELQRMAVEVGRLARQEGLAKTRALLKAAADYVDESV